MSFIVSYLEGKNAFEDGKSLDDNPYQIPASNGFDEWTRTENFTWWNGGYNSAKYTSEHQDEPQQ